MINIRIYILALMNILLFCNISISLAQTINGNLALFSQQEVDNFSGDSINGKLYISGSDITELSNLKTLIYISGDLILSSNTLLTNLSGLNNVTSIGGNLDLEFNSSLTDLGGLSNINSIGGRLDISNNSSLTNLDGFGNMLSIGDRLYISNNSALINIDGLGNIDFVGSDIIMENNPLLADLDGLNKFDSVHGNLYVSFDSALTNLDGLSNIIFVSGEFGIYFNSSLTNLDGLRNIAFVGANLNIFNNNSLNSFCGLHLLLSSNGLAGLLNFTENFVNPTKEEIINLGPCSTTNVVIEDTPNTLKDYSLQQNYPNPFNPSTKIRYSLPKSGNTKIYLFDILGREITKLVDEEKKAGNYEIEFNAENLANGIYFYRIISNNYSETRKMVLLK